jgi:hypothetical protein
MHYYFNFVLAYFTWKFVERPFRNKHIFRRSQIFVFSAAGSISFIVSGLIGYYTNGFSWRYNQSEKMYLAVFENTLPEWKYFVEGNFFLNLGRSVTFMI